ncbi:MAG: hypothetical protein JWM11_5600 [Planctomycetaceae bacterium]|nr:hypothetical protein [Planctomycetaceae bacterium]
MTLVGLSLDCRMNSTGFGVRVARFLRRKFHTLAETTSGMRNDITLAREDLLICPSDDTDERCTTTSPSS